MVNYCSQVEVIPGGQTRLLSPIKPGTFHIEATYTNARVLAVTLKSSTTCIDCANKTKPVESILSPLLQYLHPLSSASHLCTAAYIQDLDHYRLLSIPCDDSFVMDEGPFTLVCQHEKSVKGAKRDEPHNQATRLVCGEEKYHGVSTRMADRQ